MNLEKTFALKLGEMVTVGLGTHDMLVKAWKVLPEVGLTHEIDNSTSNSCRNWKLTPNAKNYFDEILLPCLRKSNHLKGKLIDIQETDTGGTMALVEIDSKRKWWNIFLLNCRVLP